MTLEEFLRALFTTGQATVVGQLDPFTPADLHQATLLLQEAYAEDKLHLPHTAPPFSAEAALWAAQVLYRAVQLTLLRDLDDTAVRASLTHYPNPINPAVVYSADLTLRYLPDLLHLAKGLAPADVLVTRLRELAQHWPFSFGGPEPAAPQQLEPVLGHPALRAAYADRIIEARNLVRAQQAETAILIREALGHYAAELWPEFN
ncbi:hypothetical protein J0X19_09110 [Hymenobacter sp. BT186]|uniref:MoxR-vWA-beta-propeller ternary system domain-containing protein n=1 Tax=Hymenobacter telluris TaxID=2816474 RepID=A0A939EWV3_9BACT|nr:hypothetical protein [Hymenobacter telluris]MBO0358100.1 hypothetical protein [Hymenobacter telluris]MBW3374127.1 hypothetical protein [Hymenobacter norwichensis]